MLKILLLNVIFYSVLIGNIKITKIKEIQLETKNNCLIGKVYNFNCDVNKNKIYIVDMADNFLIKMFNKEGAYINNLGRDGAAPGEYRQVNYSGVSNNRFYMYDQSLGRISIFENDKISKTITIGKPYRSLCFGDEYFVGLNYVTDKVVKEIEIKDYSNKLLHSFSITDINNYYVTSHLAGGSIQITTNKNRLYYLNTVDYILHCYNIDNKKKIFEKDLSKVGLKKPNLSELKKIKSLKEKAQTYDVLYTFFPLKDFILVQSRKNIFIYSKEGNFIKKIDFNSLINKFEGKLFLFDYEKNYISLVSEPYQKGDQIVNPKVFIYEIKKK